jgi:hypothetical protein
MLLGSLTIQAKFTKKFRCSGDVTYDGGGRAMCGRRDRHGKLIPMSKQVLNGEYVELVLIVGPFPQNN